jgi:hypothetical protein
VYRAQTISVSINCPVTRVYEFLADPLNLPTWLADIGPDIQHVVDNDWVVEAPAGRFTFRFGPRNKFGVLDFTVFREGDPLVPMPVRVVANGAGTDLIMIVYERPGTSQAIHASEVQWIRSDLSTLKSLLEAANEEAEE